MTLQASNEMKGLRHLWLLSECAGAAEERTRVIICCVDDTSTEVAALARLLRSCTRVKFPLRPPREILGADGSGSGSGFEDSMHMAAASWPVSASAISIETE